MPRHPFMPRRSPGARHASWIVAAFALIVTALGPVAAPVAAADGLTMEARILLGGHARLGSWVAIAVHLKNDGPAVAGELRLAGRLAGSDQVREGRRAPDAVGSGPRPVRPAPGVRQRPLRRARRRRGDDRLVQGDVHDPRRQPARRRGRRRASRGARRQLRPAAQPEPGRTGRRDPDPGRPARTAGGLGCDRPDRVAGRRLRAIVDSAT